MIERLESSEKSSEEPESKIVTYLQGHGFPKLKELDLEILASEHVTDEDARKVSEAAKSADVIAMEHPFWNKEFKMRLQDIADGKQNPSEEMYPEKDSGDFYFGLAKRLHNTGKRVALPEVRSGLKTADKINELVQVWIGFRQWLFEEKPPNRTEARDAIKFAIETGAKAHKMRESYIARYFAHELQGVLKGDPRFSDAESISVKMFMGASHTSLIPALRKVHQNTGRQLLRGQVVHAYHSEALRRVMFGLPISVELLDDALMEEVLSYIGLRPSGNLPQDGSGRALILRMIIPKLTSDERDNLYKAAMQGPKVGRDFFDSVMSKKELEIPHYWERFLNQSTNPEP